MDRFIPIPPRETERPLRLPVEAVFSIKGRGTVGSGRIVTGRVRPGDEVEIVGLRPEPRRSVVTSVETFKQIVDEAIAGESVGVLLRGVALGELERGMVIARPGSIAARTRFEAQIYALAREEGGRHTPFFDGYRPQFFFDTADVTGDVILPADVDLVMPGDSLTVEVRLCRPVGLLESHRFALRESGLTVGRGVVTKILE